MHTASPADQWDARLRGNPMTFTKPAMQPTMTTERTASSGMFGPCRKSVRSAAIASSLADVDGDAVGLAVAEADGVAEGTTLAGCVVGGAVTAGSSSAGGSTSSTKYSGTGAGGGRTEGPTC